MLIRRVMTAIAFCMITLLATQALAQAIDESGQRPQNETTSSESPVGAPSSDSVEETAATEERAARERQEKREQADLAAQQGMEEATKRMADYALWQTLLVGAGTVLLIGSLFATLRAVKVTRDIGERQVRAYVHVTKVTLENVGTEFAPAVNIHMKNFGQSPARQVRNAMNITYVAAGEPSNRRPPESVAAFELAPGQDTVTTAHTSFDGLFGMRELLEKKKSVMFVHGEISYLDIFNVARSTTYKLVLHVNPEGLRDTDSFLICKDGNSST